MQTRFCRKRFPPEVVRARDKILTDSQKAKLQIATFKGIMLDRYAVKHYGSAVCSVGTPESVTQLTHGLRV